MRIYTPNREERAFLYQEAHEMEDLMKDLGSLSVLVEEVVKPAHPTRPEFRVTFLVAPESVAMKVQATGRNLYQATIAAKDETIRQLNAIVNSLPRSAKAEEGGKIPRELLH